MAPVKVAVLPLSRPHEDNKVRNAEAYIEQNYASDISIERLARELNMSPRNFIRRFKAATGRVPGAYVQMLRMAEAKRLLESDREPIQVVASRSGYEDVAFFRSLFKRHTGMTPGEYRGRFARSGATPDADVDLALEESPMVRRHADTVDH